MIHPNNNNTNTNGTDEDEIHEKNTTSETFHLLSWSRLVILLAFIIFFPIFPLSLAVVFGGVLAWVEGEPFSNGFLYVASNLLNMTNALTNFQPENVGGLIIDVYVSVVALMTLGIVINIVNLFQVALYINQLVERVIRIRLLVPIVAIGFVIPVLFGINAVIFGAILAALEGWGVHEGFYYVLSIVLGLANPLTDLTPQTLGGDIIDIVIASMAYGCIAVFVDYVTCLNPATYIRIRIKSCLRRHGITNLAADRHPLDDFWSTSVLLSTGLDNHHHNHNNNQQQLHIHIDEEEEEKMDSTKREPLENANGVLLAKRHHGNDSDQSTDRIGDLDIDANIDELDRDQEQIMVDFSSPENSRERLQIDESNELS